MKSINSQTFKEIERRLLRLGFNSSSEGHYVLNDIHNKIVGSWLVFEKDILQKFDVDPLKEQSGHPGLWKYDTTEDDVLKIRFDLPLSILNFSKKKHSDSSSTSTFDETVKWVISTADRKLNDWSVSSLKEINLTNSEFTVLYGQFIRRGYLVCKDDVLALKIPILDHIPVELEISRRKWLHTILLDAQNRWQMIRFHMVSQQGPVEVEIDLSGAPLVLIERLLRTGMDVLRESVKWLVASVDIITNTKLKSNIFRVCKV